MTREKKPTTNKTKKASDAKDPSEHNETEATFTPYAMGKDEEYLNASQRAHFETILRDWKQSLMEEVDRTVAQMKDVPANFPDPSDRATQEEEFNIALRARDRERKLIRKIDETLERLKTDEFGYCDSCGIEIGIRRLEARPTATLCIDCKTLSEMKEKHHGDGS